MEKDNHPYSTYFRSREYSRHKRRNRIALLTDLIFVLLLLGLSGYVLLILLER